MLKSISKLSGLAIFLLVILAACGDNTATPAPNPTAVAPTATATATTVAPAATQVATSTASATTAPASTNTAVATSGAAASAVTATPTFAIPSLPPKTVVANPTAIVVTPVPARSPAAANPTSNLTPGGNNVQNLAKQAVANDMQRNYGVSVANQEMVFISETEWSDSSLGCPQPGMTYLQVITPGYLIVMKDKPQNVQYEYHTDMRGRAVMCHKTS